MSRTYREHQTWVSQTIATIVQPLVALYGQVVFSESQTYVYLQVTNGILLCVNLKDDTEHSDKYRVVFTVELGTITDDYVKHCYRRGYYKVDKAYEAVSRVFTLAHDNVKINRVVKKVQDIAVQLEPIFTALLESQDHEQQVKNQSLARFNTLANALGKDKHVVDSWGTNSTFYTSIHPKDKTTVSVRVDATGYSQITLDSIPHHQIGLVVDFLRQLTRDV